MKVRHLECLADTQGTVAMTCGGPFHVVRKMREPVSTVYWTPPSKSVWGLPKDAVPTVCFVFSVSSQLRFTGMGFCCLISRVKGYT